MCALPYIGCAPYIGCWAQGVGVFGLVLVLRSMGTCLRSEEKQPERRVSEALGRHCVHHQRAIVLELRGTLIDTDGVVLQRGTGGDGGEREVVLVLTPADGRRLTTVVCSPCSSPLVTFHIRQVLLSSRTASTVCYVRHAIRPPRTLHPPRAAHTTPRHLSEQRAPPY